MDLLIEIRSKAGVLSGHPSVDGIRAAVRHAETAERYFFRARAEGDDNLFNDVIYRTNQAFEGMLKEAFSVLTGKGGDKLSPYEVEKHLLENAVLTSRVLDLFKNYRQNWRNPSTHDHRLFFSEQEALLAIVTVCAFANILLDQVIEAAAAQKEKTALASKGEVMAAAAAVARERLHDKAVALLELFSEVLVSEVPSVTALRESEIIGRMIGFFQQVEPSITVLREPEHHEGTHYRADLRLHDGRDHVLIEVKRPQIDVTGLEQGEFQVFLLLEHFSVDSGILFVPALNAADLPGTRTIEYESGSNTYLVRTVAPRSLLREKEELDEAYSLAAAERDNLTER